LIRILDVAPMVLTISSIAFAFWLIWTGGLSGGTLVAMLGASLFGGMMIGLTVLIEERLAGAAALLVCFVVWDEKLLGMHRLGRLRRNRRARERRRGQRDEDKQAEGVYGALDTGKKRDRTEC
jgi:hypothetical protein